MAIITVIEAIARQWSVGKEFQAMISKLSECVRGLARPYMRPNSRL